MSQSISICVKDSGSNLEMIEKKKQVEKIIRLEDIICKFSSQKNGMKKGNIGCQDWTGHRSGDKAVVGRY